MGGRLTARPLSPADTLFRLKLFPLTKVFVLFLKVANQFWGRETCQTLSYIILTKGHA